MNMMARLRFFAAALLAAASVSGGETPPEIYRFDFRDPVRFEQDWSFYSYTPLVSKTEFNLRKRASAENGCVLLIETKNSSGFLYTWPGSVDLKRTPIMRWRWRVTSALPQFKDPKDAPDDQPCVIYIGDGNHWRQQSVGYRWEFDAPVGRSMVIRYHGGLTTVMSLCMRNRNTPAGEWVVEERNVLEDFKAAFKRLPSQNFLLCIGANSQHCKAITRLEIDYIEFRPASAPEKK